MSVKQQSFGPSVKPFLYLVRAGSASCRNAHRRGGRARIAGWWSGKVRVVGGVLGGIPNAGVRAVVGGFPVGGVAIGRGGRRGGGGRAVGGGGGSRWFGGGGHGHGHWHTWKKTNIIIDYVEILAAFECIYVNIFYAVLKSDKSNRSEIGRI